MPLLHDANQRALRRMGERDRANNSGGKSFARSSPLSIDQQLSGSQLVSSSASNSARVKTRSQIMGISAATTKPAVASTFGRHFALRTQTDYLPERFNGIWANKVARIGIGLVIRIGGSHGREAEREAAV